MVLPFGNYPPEYDAKVHGPYDPARYYGKADTPLAQVKLSELPAWLGRRKKSPRALMGLMSRAWWRWQHQYVQPKRGGISAFFQLATVCMCFFYLINASKIKKHRNYRYH